MKTKIRILMLAIMSVFLAKIQCTRVDFDVLSIPLTPFTGNQLRIDGYYYQIGYDGKTIVGAYFFYRNGMLVFSSGSGSSLEEMDEYIRRHFMDSNRRQHRWQYGVFLVEGDNIKFERWQPGVRAGGVLQAVVRTGTILNDTTFHITKSFRSDGTQVTERDEMFHFRAFYPKPDSTNVFVR